MVGSFTYVARDKTQTTTQKIIQARVIAQAATLALLLGGKARRTRTHVVPTGSCLLKLLSLK